VKEAISAFDFLALALIKEILNALYRFQLRAGERRPIRGPLGVCGGGEFGVLPFIVLNRERDQLLSGCRLCCKPSVPKNPLSTKILD
jgi:hypothetical protein